MDLEGEGGTPRPTLYEPVRLAPRTARICRPRAELGFGMMNPWALLVVPSAGLVPPTQRKLGFEQSERKSAPELTREKVVP